MSGFVRETDGVPVKSWTAHVEQSALDQLIMTARMPFIHRWVAAMPDVHMGHGCAVGSVVPTKGAIIPSTVGVDIACGMNAVRLSTTANELPDSLAAVRDAIEKRIPLGAGGRHQSNFDVPHSMEEGVYHLLPGFRRLLDRNPGLRKLQTEQAGWVRQIGTLGSGNHFIEICLDEEDRVWVMLHSGSRGIGNKIGRYYIEAAKREMERWFIHLPDKELAYLSEGSILFDEYWEALSWAQEYARVNRVVMMDLVIEALQDTLPEMFEITDEAINCHHNYVARENHYGANVYVTRKGAIRAREGDLGVIPGSMGTKSYIVRGKGNPESFCSCSHGAGRRMGRKEAERRFTVDDLRAQTYGIECRKDAGVLDEIPCAYKDIDLVMEYQRDLVDVVHVLHQVVNVKG